MTEEELLHKIASIIDTTHRTSFALPIYDIADQILALIKEAGYSPEEIEDMFGKYCYKHLRPYPKSTRYEGTKLIWYCRG